MARFRFVHAADLHLDTPFDGLARLGDGVPQVLRDASLQAWDNLVAETIRAEAAFLLLAGDIYDGPQRGLRAQLRFLDGLRRLSAAGIQVFMVHGNHDPVEEGWSAVRDWPEGVTVFPPGEMGSAPVERDGKRLATVHGISYRQRETTENLALHFPKQAEPGFNVALLHCNLGSHAEHAAYSPCHLDDLRAAAIDYWALGHIHAHEVVSREQPCVVYPGVLQGRSPKPSEGGAKGAVVVDVADNRVERLEFRPLDVVRFERLTFDIAGIADLAGLRDALEDRAGEAASEADGRSLVLRAVLQGRGEVHEALRRSPDALSGLLQDLQESRGQEGRGSSLSGASSANVWWDRLSDRTAAKLDKEAIRERGDFSAELLQRSRSLMEDGAALERFADTHCRPSDRRLRDVLDSGAGLSAGEILAAAEDEALERIEPEEAE